MQSLNARRTARILYTSAKTETRRARLALAESSPPRDELEKRHGEAMDREVAAWRNYLATIYTDDFTPDHESSPP